MEQENQPNVFFLSFYYCWRCLWVIFNFCIKILSLVFAKEKFIVYFSFRKFEFIFWVYGWAGVHLIYKSRSSGRGQQASGLMFFYQVTEQLQTKVYVCEFAALWKINWPQIHFWFGLCLILTCIRFSPEMLQWPFDMVFFGMDKYGQIATTLSKKKPTPLLDPSWITVNVHFTVYWSICVSLDTQGSTAGHESRIRGLYVARSIWSNPSALESLSCTLHRIIVMLLEHWRNISLHRLLSQYWTILDTIWPTESAGTHRRAPGLHKQLAAQYVCPWHCMNFLKSVCIKIKRDYVRLCVGSCIKSC